MKTAVEPMLPKKDGKTGVAIHRMIVNKFSDETTVKIGLRYSARDFADMCGKFGIEKIDGMWCVPDRLVAHLMGGKAANKVPSQSVDLVWTPPMLRDPTAVALGRRAA